MEMSAILAVIYNMSLFTHMKTAECHSKYLEIFKNDVSQLDYDTEITD